MWKYLAYRPRVVVMGLPCTSFGLWSRVNRRTNPAAFLRARRIGVKLANLATDVALFQQYCNHFVCENPQSSEMWMIPSWRYVLSQPEITSTILVASNPCLIRRLNLLWDFSHDNIQLAGHANGIVQGKYAQAWPRRMVEMLMVGILDL